jgi:hypothetical protein
LAAVGDHFCSPGNTAILALRDAYSRQPAFLGVVLHSKVPAGCGLDVIAPCRTPLIVFGALLLTLFVLQRAADLRHDLICLMVPARISYGTRMTNSA